jgi:hypothetical protein
LRSLEELGEYKTIFQYDKLEPLLKSVDSVNLGSNFPDVVTPNKIE